MRYLLLAAMLLAGPVLRAAETFPPDRKSPEAHALLAYLAKIEGKQVLSGMNDVRHARTVYELTGKWPAVLGLDMSGWDSPTWGESYRQVVRRSIDEAKAWHAAGGIVTLHFHWKNPARADGSAWVKDNHGTGPFDVAKAVVPGSEAHRQVMRDLERTADYLEELRDARIPVLWRPLHEIEGGWFWWTDSEHPENTAQLWRLMHDHLVRERNLNNLIWVYSSGVSAGDSDRLAVERRRRFYPGGEYVDIAGIDIYPTPWHGWQEPWDDTYSEAFGLMQQVAPGKPLALSECKAMPSPAEMERSGPRWLWVMPWWAGTTDNPPDWIREGYQHPLLITRDELPSHK